MPQIRANGIDIEYESFGREGDPPVLLIMGVGAQMILWPESFCGGLADRGFHVIRFDNRDIGKSTHLAKLGTPDLGKLIMQRQLGQSATSPYSLDDMALDAVMLLDVLGIETAHIVGASMGGMIAQLVAIKHPKRARSLVSIMSTTGRPDLPPSRPDVLAALMMPPASPSRADRIEASIRVMKALASPGFPIGDAERRAFAERATDRAPFDPAGVARQMAAIIAAPARNLGLRSLQLPALVIHGADDLLLPLAGGRDTADSIPGAKFVVVPGMAHDLAEPLVPTILKEVGGFIETVEAGRG